MLLAKHKLLMGGIPPQTSPLRHNHECSSGAKQSDRGNVCLGSFFFSKVFEGGGNLRSVDFVTVLVLWIVLTLKYTGGW